MLTLSAGLKVGDLKEFFSDPTKILDGLFLRIDTLSISAIAEANGLDLSLFPSILLEDGSFLLSAGAKLSMPFEITLDNAGNLTNGIGLKKTLESRLSVEPHGKVSANLPFTVDIDSFTQKLAILIHDDNLFDRIDLLVKVDFDICALSGLLQELLGKLGSFQLSVDSIIGEGNSLPFDLSEITDSFDYLFPDVGQFVNGVLEAKSELFHLCKEIEVTGAPPPRLEDVISMILEDIVGESEGIAAVSTSQTIQRRRMLHVPDTHHLDIHHNGRPSELSRGRRRALRAHHLPYNRFKRPRRLGHQHRHLSSDVAGDLMDAISVEGGYDGSTVFFKLELDVSKQAVSSLDDLLKAPLDLLTEADFFESLFNSSVDSPLTVESDISLSAGAHISIRGKMALGETLSQSPCQDTG